jgi:hypothetical protein
MAVLVTRIYPRGASILLIITAVLSGASNILSLIGGVGTAGAYGGVIRAIVDIIFYASIVWLGFSLFRGRAEEALGNPRAAFPRRRPYNRKLSCRELPF